MTHIREVNTTPTNYTTIGVNQIFDVSTTPVQLLPENTNRVSFFIQNIGTVSAIIRADGTTPSTTNLTAILAPDNNPLSGEGGVFNKNDLATEIKAVTESGATKVVVFEVVRST